MRYNKVEYSTAAGVYCTTPDVKLPFLHAGIFYQKDINHHYHVDNNKGKSDIVYDIIIVRDLMVHLDLTADFKRQVLQWDGATVHMEEPSSLLRQSFQLSARYMRWL